MAFSKIVSKTLSARSSRRQRWELFGQTHRVLSRSNCLKTCVPKTYASGREPPGVLHFPHLLTSGSRTDGLKVFISAQISAPHETNAVLPAPKMRRPEYGVVAADGFSLYAPGLAHLYD
jgi:hypothetical protein